jgi:hypothetical protein
LADLPIPQRESVRTHTAPIHREYSR